MTATFKSKQTSIATVRYHLLPGANLLTHLIFHYPLPLNKNLPNFIKNMSFVESCVIFFTEQGKHLQRWKAELFFLRNCWYVKAGTSTYLYRHQIKCRQLKIFTCKGTLRQVFIRVCRLKSCWYFRPSGIALLSPLSGSTPPLHLLGRVGRGFGLWAINK